MESVRSYELSLKHVQKVRTNHLVLQSAAILLLTFSHSAFFFLPFLQAGRSVAYLLSLETPGTVSQPISQFLLSECPGKHDCPILQRLYTANTVWLAFKLASFWLLTIYLVFVVWQIRIRKSKNRMFNTKRLKQAQLWFHYALAIQIVGLAQWFWLLWDVKEEMMVAPRVDIFMVGFMALCYLHFWYTYRQMVVEGRQAYYLGII